MTLYPAPLIVGIDGSAERSRDALMLAARLADPGQRLLLIHVHPYGALSSLMGAQYDTLLGEIADSTLARAEQTLDPPIEHETRLVSHRSPAAGLHELATDVGAALIVVGSSHRSGLRRVLVGSVAESTLLGAPVPVAIAAHCDADGEHVLRTIGCGFDGSPESHEALEWAADLARRRGARLAVLAVHGPLAFGGVSTGGAVAYQAANNALHRMHDQKMRTAIASLEDPIDVDGRLLIGDPVTELTEASADLDLLALGSRGYGPLRTALLGSVSRGLARSAACSIVVLPRGAATT
jgi:nucleotide-binding universal stress UspA family protein